MSWISALLLGAVLSPTDPVFVAAIFRVEEVPQRIRRALNVESGMNDGLALTAVVVLLSAATAKHDNIVSVIWQLALGVLIGIAVPWLGIRIEETRFFEAVGVFQPLLGFSLAVLVYAICVATGGNEFLAAFSAGVAMASVSRKASESLSSLRRGAVGVVEVSCSAYLRCHHRKATGDTFVMARVSVHPARGIRGSSVRHRSGLGWNERQHQRTADIWLVRPEGICLCGVWHSHPAGWTG